MRTLLALAPFDPLLRDAVVVAGVFSHVGDMLTRCACVWVCVCVCVCAPLDTTQDSQIAGAHYTPYRYNLTDMSLARGLLMHIASRVDVPTAMEDAVTLVGAYVALCNLFFSPFSEARTRVRA